MAQPELAARLPIPISTSSLVQVPSILAFLPHSAALSIITYNAGQLKFEHLERLGVAPAAKSRIHIVGPPTGGHLQSLVQEEGPYSKQGIENEMVEAAKKLNSSVANLQAIVLECMQMPPFAAAVQSALGGGIKVYDVHTMGCWFYSGLVNSPPARWLTREA